MMAAVAERNGTPATLSDFVRWLEVAPAGTSLSARSLLDTLLPLVTPSTPAPERLEPAGATWRERLWLVPAETRIGVPEVAEALGRPVSFVYRHTSEKAAGADRLPHRKLDGELLFVVGEVRSWVRDHEEVVTACRAESATLTLSPRRTS